VGSAQSLRRLPQARRHQEEGLFQVSSQNKTKEKRTRLKKKRKNFFCSEIGKIEAQCKQYLYCLPSATLPT
jgi:hypothetical protein